MFPRLVVTASTAAVAFLGVPAGSAVAGQSNFHDRGLGALVDRTTAVSPGAGLRNFFAKVGSAAPATAPDSVDLSAYDPPVGDQGPVNSCVAWAEDYGMLGWYANEQGHSGAPFAPMYVYSQIQAEYGWQDGGAYSNDGYRYAQAQGVDSQADYWQGNYDWQDLPTAQETASAAVNKTQGFAWIYTTRGGSTSPEDAIKAVLASGRPAAMSIPVYTHWYNLTAADNVYRHADDQGSYYGNHEVLITGYDATGIRIQNSWGTGWGNAGHATIAWDFVNNDSNDATAMTGFASTALPGRPTGFAIASHPATLSATITWAPPASDGGSIITGYRVSRDGVDSNGTGPWSKVVAASARTQTFGNLIAADSYTLSVQAINATGAGTAASGSVSISTAPGAPTRFAVAKNDATRNAIITWAPPISDGGSAITSYRVARDGTDAKGTGPWSKTVAATARSQTFSNLVPGRKYTLSVAATNATGTGPAKSAQVTITRLPGTPTIGTAASGSLTDTVISITGRWSAPTSGGPVTSYHVTAINRTTGARKTVSVSATARSKQITGLVKNGSYVVTVYATNDTGNGATSARSNAVIAR